MQTDRQQVGLTLAEIYQELGVCKTIRALGERMRSMKAAHPESEASIEAVFRQIQTNLMADYTLEGGL